MNYEHWIVYQMKEEKRIFPFMYMLSLRKFMIMIAKNYIEFRFRLFWGTLYKQNLTTHWRLTSYLAGNIFFVFGTWLYLSTKVAIIT